MKESDKKEQEFELLLYRLFASSKELLEELNKTTCKSIGQKHHLVKDYKTFIYDEELIEALKNQISSNSKLSSLINKKRKEKLFGKK